MEATYQATAEEIHRAPSLLAFIDLRQWGTLRTLPAEFLHPEASLLKFYAEEGIPVST